MQIKRSDTLFWTPTLFLLSDVSQVVRISPRRIPFSSTSAQNSAAEDHHNLLHGFPQCLGFDGFWPFPAAAVAGSILALTALSKA